MGEVRQRQFRYCTVCDREATKACRTADHPCELRTWPIWQIRYYRDGRRFEESSRSTKRGDAERLPRLREGDIAKGVPVSPQLGRFRFEDAAADIEAEYVVNGRRSLPELKRRIALRLKPAFLGRRLSSMTTTDIRAHYRESSRCWRSAGRDLPLGVPPQRTPHSQLQNGVGERVRGRRLPSDDSTRYPQNSRSEP